MRNARSEAGVLPRPLEIMLFFTNLLEKNCIKKSLLIFVDSNYFFFFSLTGVVNFFWALSMIPFEIMLYIMYIAVTTYFEK